MLRYSRIKFERQRIGWTQAELANHPEVRRVRPRIRQQEVSQIELGWLVPTPKQLDALARALGVANAAVLLKPVVIVDSIDEPTISQPEPAEARV